ncbi:MAG: hypothetical protein V2I43_02890 [Parvularcula sp.]|jgi:hypothetical protein|nr:hypothetical protein [Parvularcula sp.]
MPRTGRAQPIWARHGRGCLTAVFGLGCFSEAAAAPTTVFHEDFESESILGDTILVERSGAFVLTEGIGIQIHRNGNASGSSFSGDHYVALDIDLVSDIGRSPNSAMAALVDFEVGSSYEIGFAYRPLSFIEDDSIIEVTLGEMDSQGVFAPQWLAGIASASRLTQPDWLLVTFAVTAAEGMNAVQFAAGGPGTFQGGLLDTITIRQVPISHMPVPGAGLLLVSGLAALGLRSRLRGPLTR